MNSYKFLVLICISTSLFAQKTKKETIKKGAYKEVYEVLADDHTVKHGRYQKLYKNEVQENGFYKNNIKDSTWTDFVYRNKQKGSYTNGNRTGIWEFYDNNDILIQKYNYSTREIVYFSRSKEDQEEKYKIVRQTDTLLTKLDRPPLYIGGINSIQNFIFKNYNKSNAAQEKEGVIKISFTIDSTGTAINYKILEGMGYGCEEAMLTIIKSAPNGWIPGLLSGKPTNTIQNMTFIFKIR